MLMCDRCARLFQTIPTASSSTSQGRGMSCPIVLPTCQLLGPTVPYPLISAVRSRRPAASEFASECHLRWLSSRNIGACRSPRHAEHARRDLEFRRCITSHAASQSRPSACETPSDRSLQGERRRSDGKATTLRSSRSDLAVFRSFHAFGTSMRLWGCAGRSYPSHSTTRSPAMWWERGSWREQVAPIQPQAGTGRGSVWACFVRRKLSPNPASSDGKRSSRCSHVTRSIRQPLPACSR
jgi:hypothetical protein